MLNIIKSIVIILIIVFLFWIFINNIIHMITKMKNPKKAEIIKRILINTISVIMIIMMFPYCMPFNINVKFEEIACVELKEGTFEEDDEWYSIYNINYGPIKVSDDAYFKYPNIPPYNGEFAEIDTSKYTYIYTIGAPLKEIQYNVWDCEGIPVLDFGLSTKWGRVVFGVDEEDNKVYMYRIPRIAIANEENTMRH